MSILKVSINYIRAIKKYLVYIHSVDTLEKKL